MWDYNGELHQLIEEYGLVPRMAHCSEIMIFMQQIWDACCAQGRVLVLGTATHTHALMNLLYKGDSENLWVSLVDATDDVKSVNGVMAIPYQELKVEEYDVVFISAYRERNDIKRKLDIKDIQVEIIDPYDLLESESTFQNSIGHPFYICIDYREVHELRKQYEQCADPELLLELVSRYLDMRDFVYARYFAEQYMNRGYRNADRIRSFFTRLDSLFTRMREDARVYSGDAVNLIITDAVRGSDFFGEYAGKVQTPFIQMLAEVGCRFDCAYSPSLDTLRSIYSIFTGTLPLDDNVYWKREINVDESEMLRRFCKEGRRMNHYVGWKEFFGADTRVNRHTVRSAMDSGVFLARAVTPRILWELLCNLYKEHANKSFNLLHLFYETHEPHVCGFHEHQIVFHRFYEYLGGEVDFTENEYKRQYSECLQYIDAQLSFYLPLIPQNSINAVFGDHGQPCEKILSMPPELGPIMSFHDVRASVPLILWGNKVPVMKINKFFNLKDLTELIIRIIDGTSFEDLLSDYTEYQYDPIYFDRIIEAYRRVGLEGYLRGFKVVRDMQFKYVVFDDGEEQLFCLPNECTNVLDDYPSSAEKLRKKLKRKEFPNFYSNTKYAYNSEIVRDKQGRKS